MAKKTIGKNLNSRPTAGEPNDTFIDLSTDKTYVFEDGEWQEVPMSPAVKLPVVTAADAGKVLTVDETGKWVAASLPE